MLYEKTILRQHRSLSLPPDTRNVSALSPACRPEHVETANHSWIFSYKAFSFSHSFLEDLIWSVSGHSLQSNFRIKHFEIQTTLCLHKQHRELHWPSRSKLIGDVATGSVKWGHFILLGPRFSLEQQCMCNRYKQEYENEALERTQALFVGKVPVQGAPIFWASIPHTPYNQGPNSSSRSDGKLNT